MERENLLQLTTKKCSLALRGVSTSLAETAPMTVSCSDGVTAAAVCGKEIAVCDGMLPDVPRLCMQKLQIVLQSAAPMTVMPPLMDMVQSEDGRFCTGYLDLETECSEISLTVLCAGTAYLQLGWESYPGQADCNAAMTTELQSMLRDLAVQQLRGMDPDFLAEGWSEAKLQRALEDNYDALLETADQILTELEEQPGLRLFKRRTVYDTAENRLVKHILRSAARCLADIADDEKIGALNSRANRETLAHAGAYHATEETRPDAMAPVYQVLHQQYRRLCAAVALLQLKIDLPMPQRYRLWAFLKITALLRNRYPMVAQTILVPEEKQIRLLFRDQTVHADFGDPGHGSAIRLSADPTGQILLQKSGEAVYGFTVCNRADHALHPEALLAAYHRRNELFYQNRGGGTGSFVLFPGTDTPEYRQSEAYTLINRELLGGIPLLPGEDQLLQRLLDKLVCGIPMLDFEPAVLPTELEMKLEQVDWSRRNVLVGALRNPEQLDLCLRRHFYHIPAHLVESSAHPIGYVALYQSRNLFGRDAGIRYYGEVAEYNAVPRYTIKESPSYSKETYYRFAIKKWYTLPRTIPVWDAGSVAKLTNLFLLQNSDTDTGLLFANEEMFRLYYALRQAVEAYGAGDGDPETGFTLADHQVAVYQGKICVFRDRSACGEVPISLWQKRPRQALEQIYGYMFPKEEKQE